MNGCRLFRAVTQPLSSRAAPCPPGGVADWAWFNQGAVRVTADGREVWARQARPRTVAPPRRTAGFRYIGTLAQLTRPRISAGKRVAEPSLRPGKGLCNVFIGKGNLAKLGCYPCSPTCRFRRIRCKAREKPPRDVTDRPAAQGSGAGTGVRGQSVGRHCYPRGNQAPPPWRTGRTWRTAPPQATTERPWSAFHGGVAGRRGSGRAVQPPRGRLGRSLALPERTPDSTEHRGRLIPALTLYRPLL
jgi:hypothetical protein